MGKRKNKLLNIPKVKKGDIVMTRDNFLEASDGYVKPKHINDDLLYRESLAIKVDEDGRMVLVKIQSGGKDFFINKANQIERFNPNIKTKDDNGKDIVLNKKFRKGKSKYGATEEVTDAVLSKVMNHKNKKIRKQNKKKMSDFLNKK